MSSWTHIVAAIDVDTFIDSHTIQQDVEKLLAAAPKITGSEGDADVFVNVLSGYNHHIYRDCERCDFYEGESSDGKLYCRKGDGDSCLDSKFQTRVVITVIGDLRDRDREETKQEWLAFKTYIYKSVNDTGFWVRNCSCNILAC